MNITFVPLAESHFPLLLKWLKAPHVKKWWDKDVHWTPVLIQKKYGDYIKGYKFDNGVAKSINAYIIYADEKPIGYIQIYNAYDFSRENPLVYLPKNLAGFDVLIGEADYLKQGIGSKAIALFLDQYATFYSHIFVDTERTNIVAIRAYEKAGFKKTEHQPHANEIWMLRKQRTINQTQVLEELKAREPIFHHPDKFGKTKQDILDITCDEFWEVGASGNRYSREYVIEVLLDRYSDPEYKDIWETKDFKCQEIAHNNYLITYTLLQGKRVTKRSTIWRRTSSGWKILYHQGTVVQETGDEHKE